MLKRNKRPESKVGDTTKKLRSSQTSDAASTAARQSSPLMISDDASSSSGSGRSSGASDTDSSGNASSASSSSCSSSSSVLNDATVVHDDGPTLQPMPFEQRWRIFSKDFFVACPLTLTKEISYDYYTTSLVPEVIGKFSLWADGASLVWLREMFMSIVDIRNTAILSDAQVSLLVTSLECIIKNETLDDFFSITSNIITAFYLLSQCINDDIKNKLFTRLCDSETLKKAFDNTYAVWKILLRFPLTGEDIKLAESTINSLDLNKNRNMTTLWFGVIFHSQLMQLIRMLGRHQHMSFDTERGAFLELGLRYAAAYNDYYFYYHAFTERQHSIEAIQLLYQQAILTKNLTVAVQLLPLYPSLYQISASELRYTLTESGDSLLHVALQMGGSHAARIIDDEMSHAIIQTQINTLNHLGFTPLYLAVNGGHHTVIEDLVGLGALIDISAPYPIANVNGLHNLIQMAAIKRDYRMISTMIKIVPPSVDKDKRLKELLFWGAKNGDVTLVKILSSHGVQTIKWTVNVSTPLVHTSVLHQAAAAGQVEVVQFLISANLVSLDLGSFDTNSGGYQNTALHLAARQGHLAVVKLLITAGASKSAQNTNKWTVLHSAAAGGNIGVMTYLLRELPDACQKSKTDRGETILHLAVEYGHLELVKFLVDKNADVFATARAKATPLSYAAEFGHLPIVKFLRDVIDRSNCNIETREDCLNHAFHKAITKGKNDVINYLCEIDSCMTWFLENSQKTLQSAFIRENTKLLTYSILRGLDVYELASDYKCFNKIRSVPYNLLLSGIAVIDTPKISPALVKGLESMLLEIQTTNVDLSQLTLAGLLSCSSSHLPRQGIFEVTKLTAPNFEKTLRDSTKTNNYPPYIDAFGKNHLDSALAGESSSIQFLARMQEPAQTIFVNSLVKLADILSPGHLKKAPLLALHQRLVDIRKPIEHSSSMPLSSHLASSSAMFSPPALSGSATSSSSLTHSGTTTSPSSLGSVKSYQA